MPAYIRPWLTVLFGWARGRRGLVLENAAVRQQLAMHERRRPEIRDSDRLFWLLLVRFWPGWRSALVAVQPETVVRWHRAGWRRYWTWRSRARHRGRPRIDPEARELIMRLARENPLWGAVRIQGELRALGHEVSAETVRRYRLRALRRPPSQSWRAFLRNHRHEIWAADFFTVPTLSLTTLYVFFLVSHGRRRIEHVHVTRHPTAEWVWRQMIEATPWGRRPRFLIRDRDRSYGGDFIERARRIGIKTVLPSQRAAEGKRDRVCLRRHAATGVRRPHHPTERASATRGARGVRRVLQRDAAAPHARTGDAGRSAPGAARWSCGGTSCPRRHPPPLRARGRLM